MISNWCYVLVGLYCVSMFKIIIYCKNFFYVIILCD